MSGFPKLVFKHNLNYLLNMHECAMEIRMWIIDFTSPTLNKPPNCQLIFVFDSIVIVRENEGGRMGKSKINFPHFPIRQSCTIKCRIFDFSLFYNWKLKIHRPQIASFFRLNYFNVMQSEAWEKIEEANMLSCCWYLLNVKCKFLSFLLSYS